MKISVKNQNSNNKNSIKKPQPKNSLIKFEIQLQKSFSGTLATTVTQINKEDNS